MFQSVSLWFAGVQHPVLSCVEKNTEKVITDLYCSDIIGAGLELKRACNIQKCLERYARLFPKIPSYFVNFHHGSEGIFLITCCSGPFS